MRARMRLLSACVVLGSVAAAAAGARAEGGIVDNRAAEAAYMQLAQGLAAAARPDGTLRARIEDAQQRYEAAVVAGDADAVAALFTPDGRYMPFFGGAFEGSAAIRAFTAQRPPPAAIDVWSEGSEVAGGFVFDRGGFRLEAGDSVITGEYVAWAEDTTDGVKLRQLITYLPRELPRQTAAR